MSATGLDVFDKTMQTTNTWLDKIMEELGPDRQVAWHALTAVLRALRDHLPLELSAHLESQLPILVRGAYYDQWQPEKQPDRCRSLDEFLEQLGNALSDLRLVNAVMPPVLSFKWSPVMSIAGRWRKSGSLYQKKFVESGLRVRWTMDPAGRLRIAHRNPP